MRSSSNIITLADDESDLRPLVPPGEYMLKLIGHQTKVFYKTPRLIFDLCITDFGDFHGVKLQRFYNVSRLIGKPGKNGRCKHKQTGDFMMEFYKLFPKEPKRRLDRIPLEMFYNVEIIGRVRTVTTNNRQQELPAQLQHSVVGELLRVSE